MAGAGRLPLTIVLVMAFAQPRPRLGSRVLTRASTAAVGVAALVAALLVASLYLRTRALGASLWMDEGLSIGIASQPFFDIPGVLRQDGSPPLYYLLLNAWMAIFGRGPAETQALSLVFALAFIPAALWAGWTLFGRRAGLIAAALGALNPFFTIYAQETRMYSLLGLLGLLAATAFVRAFVDRRRAYVPVFAALLAAILYTHNWGLFLTVGALCAFGVLARTSGDRPVLLRDGLLAFGGAALLYLPWLPTLLYQTAHTGAPWLDPPGIDAALVPFSALIASGGAAVALALGAGTGLLRKGVARDGAAVRTLLVLAGATLIAAFVVSQVAPAWTARYFGVVLGPLLLVAAAGLARAGTLGLVALAATLAFWALPPTDVVERKSNAAELAADAASRLDPGDLVVSGQPEQTPLLAYHFGSELDYATTMGPAGNPAVMEWRDALERLRSATPAETLEPLIAKLPPRGHVLFVQPVTSGEDNWDAPWTELVRRRSAQWGDVLASDGRLTRSAVLPRYYGGATRVGVRGVLYTKRPPK